MEAHTSRPWDASPPGGPDPLFGPDVARALAALAGERDALRCADRLRALLPSSLAPRAAALAQLRLRMQTSHPKRPPLYSTTLGLSMASPEEVAWDRAREIARRCPGAWVLDATCGVGVDSLALAAAGARTVAADRDPHHVRCTAANLESHGFPARVLVADALRPAMRADVLVLDPDRRPGGRRTLDPDRWSPTLDAATRLAQGVAAACLKLAPALSVERVALPPGAWRWRWVSLSRELVEVTLLSGELARAAPGTDPPREVSAWIQGRWTRFEAAPIELAPWPAEALDTLPWLAEPDPALIRSGLLTALARQEGLRPIDARSAYLGGELRPSSPLLVPWRVLGTSPLDRKRVRALLERHDVGPLEVHKRGLSEPAEELARRLAGRGSRRGVLIAARTDSGRRAFLVEDPGPPPGGAGAEPSGPGGGVGDEGFEPPTSSL